MSRTLESFKNLLYKLLLSGHTRIRQKRNELLISSPLEIPVAAAAGIFVWLSEKLNSTCKIKFRNED